MAFIGIIVGSKNETQIKRILENKLNATNKKYTIIIINDKSIINIRNIKFETILAISLDQISNKFGINEIFKNTKYLIINSDLDSNLEAINDIEVNLITFGFNQKSTITASSVEDGIMMCIQRKIVNINKKDIEPQEIKVKVTNKRLLNSAHNSMGIATTLLIYGKNEIFF